MMLCLRMNMLFTLCTLLNVIACCLQLNTGRGTDVNLKADFLGTDACWIAVCVLCRNAQMNLIVDTTTCTCILCTFQYCQCPAVIYLPSMLVIYYGETPLVNYGPRSILLHLKYNLLQSLLFLIHCK